MGPVDRTIVFCNKIETCNIVQEFLHKKVNFIEKNSGLRPHIVSIHNKKSLKHKHSSLNIFLQPPSPQEHLILVCTDKISKGLDTIFAKHVVIFDFPRNPSEYFRRVGRTSRGAEGKGKVTILATNEQVILAREITSRNRMGIPIHHVV